jgi:uncharacterized YccA/Bax inhibitor family protein
MRTANPTLNSQTFRSVPTVAGSQTMTLQGTANKALVLVTLLFGSALWTWQLASKAIAAGAGMETVVPWAVGGAIAGLVLSLVTVFAKSWSPVTAPLYAIAEGLFLGWISALFNKAYSGIAFQAISLTILTLVSLLIAYRTGIIRATENFKLGVFAATGAIGLMYLLSFILSLCGMPVPYIHGSGPIGIGVSVVIVVIAALNLVLDFDFIESGVQARAPRYMEWYGAFGLLVTLVWLYVEILRLLSKLRSRD